MPDDAMDAPSRTRTGLPLAGLRVLDLTLARAGPTCVRHLADWGADIIRVEPPRSTDGLGGPRDGFDSVNLHRNKRSIALDLKHPDGHAAFLKLAATADVVVENMRMQVKHRLKIAYDEAYARFSPGVLLELDNLDLLARGDIDWMDSCAAENHPMIDSLWGERRTIVRVSLPLAGTRRRLSFAGWRAIEVGWASAKHIFGREK